MDKFLIEIFKWFNPAVIGFFTPDRFLAVVGMIQETIEFSKDLSRVKTTEEVYNESLEYLTGLYKKWDESEKYPDTVDRFVVGTIFPLLLSFVLGSPPDDNGQ